MVAKEPSGCDCSVMMTLFCRENGGVCLDHVFLCVCVRLTLLLLVCLSNRL